MKLYYFNLENIEDTVLKEIESGDMLILYINCNIYICINHYDTYNCIFNNNSISFCYKQELSENLKFANEVIFSFDGVNKRKGNVSLLYELAKIIKDEDFNNLFFNIISILEYKEDRLDSSLLIKVLNKQVVDKVLLEDNLKRNVETCVKEKEIDCYEIHRGDTISKKSEERAKGVNPFNYYFYDYLDENCKQLWIEQYAKLMSTHEIFKILKSKYKISFSKAFREFTSQNKDLNLYSLKVIRKNKNEINRPEFNRVKELGFIYDCLKNKGFIQVADNKWEDAKGNIYNISINKDVN